MTGYLRKPPVNKIELLFFGNLSAQLNCNSESCSFEQDEITVAELKQQLQSRGDNWKTALAAESIKCAINQAIAEENDLIKNGDEVAFFPPVTGG